ncbi:MAG TPA: hypothetical protein VGK73_23250 [Polyangiaceae bacterium]
MNRRPLRILAALATALLGLLASSRAEAQFAEPETALPAPSADQPDLPSPAAPVNLALTGAAITGVWYGGALGASLLWSNAPWSTEMKIPIAGPWLSLNQLSCGNEPNCTTLLVVVRAVLVTIDGVGQAAGLAIAAESLFLPTAEPPRAKSKSARLRPFPLVTSDAIGVGVAGEL